MMGMQAAQGAGVRMTGIPRAQPVRTMLPNLYLMEGTADNGGGTGAMRILSRDGHYKVTENIEDPVFNKHGDEDLTQGNFTVQPFEPGVVYGGIRAGVASLQDGGAKLIEEAYHSVLAQAQRLRNNTHYNTQGLTRAIWNPDKQSLYEVGYTLPLQWFAYQAKKHFLGTFGPGTSPAGRNAPGSMKASQHPTLKRPIPVASIPTAMPWNVSAPGAIY